MKKMMTLLMAAMMMLSLAACGGKTEEVKSADLAAFYEETMTALVEEKGQENVPMMMALEGEMLDAFYPGLSEVATKQCIAYAPAMSAVAAEVVLVEVENAEDVEKVQEILQARIDAQIAGGAWYPETIEGWKNNSRIAVSGNCVMMIAYSECDAVVDAFNGLFA